MAARTSTARRLANLLSEAPPVYALDDRRRIVYCNPACADSLGMTPDQLDGRQCDYSADGSTAESLFDALCPPPEAFLGSRVETVLVVKLETDRVLRRRVSFVPLRGNRTESSGVLAFMAPEDEPPGSTDGQKSSTDALEVHRRLQELVCDLRRPFRLERLVGESPGIRRVREQVELAIRGHARVAIVGPEGSGREVIARTIHAAATSDRSGPLLLLDCPLLAPDLLQSSVMSFLRESREETTEQAGALLLRDVDEASFESQLELLSFFQLPTFGVRTLATARRPFQQLVAEGKIIRELALALSPLEITIPPLCERRQDIPFLAQQRLEEANAARDAQLGGFTTEALDCLCSLPWPGDVEELRAIVGEACERAEGPRVGRDELPRRVTLLASAAAHPPKPPVEEIKLDDFLLEVETELIRRAMRQADGNKAQAARLLGIKRSRLLRRLKQLEL